MLRESKAQVSVEFLSMIGVVLLIFVGLYMLISAQNRSANEVSLQFNLQRVCNEFSAAINLAATGGPGFTAHIKLLNKTRSLEYNITIASKTMLVNAAKTRVTCRLITSNVYYSAIEKGTDLNIINSNGTILIQKA